MVFCPARLVFLCYNFFFAFCIHVFNTHGRQRSSLTLRFFNFPELLHTSLSEDIRYGACCERMEKEQKQELLLLRWCGLFPLNKPLYFTAFLYYFFFLSPAWYYREIPQGKASPSLPLSETYVNLNKVLMTYCIKPCNNSLWKRKKNPGAPIDSSFYFIHRPPPSHHIFLSICSSVLASPLFSFLFLLSLTLTASFHLSPPIHDCNVVRLKESSRLLMRYGANYWFVFLHCIPGMGGRGGSGGLGFYHQFSFF